MHTCAVYTTSLVMSDLLHKHTTRWEIYVNRRGLPWGSLRPRQVGRAWLPCRPSWTSWNNAMFMLSSVKVQVWTLCSELDSGAVYINPPKSPSPLEGCFQERRRLMFNRAVQLSAAITTLREPNLQLHHIGHVHWEFHGTVWWQFSYIIAFRCHKERIELYDCFCFYI